MRGIKGLISRIISKVNVIARLNFKVSYDDVAVQLINVYSTGTPLHLISINKKYYPRTLRNVEYSFIAIELISFLS